MPTALSAQLRSSMSSSSCSEYSPVYRSVSMPGFNARRMESGSNRDWGIPWEQLRFHQPFGCRERGRRGPVTSSAWLVCCWCRKIRTPTTRKISLGSGRRGHDMPWLEFESCSRMSSSDIQDSGLDAGESYDNETSGCRGSWLATKRNVGGEDNDLKALQMSSLLVPPFLPLPSYLSSPASVLCPRHQLWHWHSIYLFAPISCRTTRAAI